MEPRSDRTNPTPPVWQFAVLFVSSVSVPNPEWTGVQNPPGMPKAYARMQEYRAWALVDGTPIYSRKLDTIEYSGPLADLGRDGWELVSHQAHHDTMQSMTFFLKRPSFTD